MVRKNKLIRINLFIGLVSQSSKLDSFNTMTVILFFMLKVKNNSINDYEHGY